MLARLARGDAIVVLGFRPADPTGYGRLITGARNTLQAIVEHADATREQRGIGLCNSGVMAVDAKHLFERSEEHTSELQSLMRNSYAVFCLKKKKNHYLHTTLKYSTTH